MDKLQFLVLIVYKHRWDWITKVEFEDKVTV